MPELNQSDRVILMMIDEGLITSLAGMRMNPPIIKVVNRIGELRKKGFTFYETQRKAKHNDHIPGAAGTYKIYSIKSYLVRHGSTLYCMSPTKLTENRIQDYVTMGVSYFVCYGFSGEIRLLQKRFVVYAHRNEFKVETQREQKRKLKVVIL